MIKEILSTQQLSTLISIGFLACSKGQVFKARALFEGLLQADPELTSAKTGLAFSYIVVDDFEKADLMLLEISEKEPYFYEAKGFLTLSKCLQKKFDEAKEIAACIPDTETAAKNLANNALALGE